MQKSYSYLLLLSGGVSAHTWLEALRSIGSNGAFTGEPGYSRGFVARTDPAFSDNAATYRITAKDASTPLCHPAQQVANGYSNPQFPRLNASAGSFVALKYQENGHVSAPQVQRAGHTGLATSTSTLLQLSETRNSQPYTATGRRTARWNLAA